MLQDVVQQVEDTAKSVVSDIHTALPGVITEYDPSKNLAKVQPVGRFFTANKESLSYPLLTEVPLSFPYSQTADVGMVFPVNVGDYCMIIISEVELDQWRKNAETDAPLRFDLTSAMAIPSLILGSPSRAEKACGEQAVVINSGATEIVVRGSNVEITGDVIINGNFTLNGNSQVNGNETVTGTGIIGGITVNTHTHGGVKSGGSNTSGPN